MIGEMGKTEKVGIGQKPEKTSQSGYCGGGAHWSESYGLITGLFHAPAVHYDSRQP